MQGSACEYREVHANAGNCVTTLRTGKIQGSISVSTDTFLYYLVLTMFSSPESQTLESSQPCSRFFCCSVSTLNVTLQ